MHMNRRNVLKALTLGAGTFALTPFRAPLKANPKEPLRNFIFCYFQGGWDHLLCLDPRDPNSADFKDSNSKNSKIMLDWDRCDLGGGRSKFNVDLVQPSGSNIAFGPVMESFANNHFQDSCVVRGISMDTVSHQVGRRYFITGKMPQGSNANGSSIPTQIVAEQGDLSIIPNLSVRVETYNQGHQAFASGLRVSSVDDLLSTLKDGPSSPKNEMRKLLEAYRRDVPDCDPVSLNADGLMTLLKDAQKKSRVLVDSNLGKLFNFNDTSNSELAALKKRYRIPSSLSSTQAQAAMAYQAIKYQVAQCVSIEIARGLDTHGPEWSTLQPQRLYDGFELLDTLVTDLKQTPHPLKPSKTLFDYTTILCFSEFTRTTLINSRDGRDHSLVNSALLIGAGVPSNKVIGASSKFGMNPEAISPVTGEIDTGSDAVVLTPKLVLASVMDNAGYDIKNFRLNEGLPCFKPES
ncbi:MAG: hypothetical protein CL920_12315 [Deltaproteobacteria bacterium]|nr:hypothetical protein [Deltaproteobacteria bacterium]MBU49470.1 hypothetical protein [Deltaproteobacteria bacterium]|tara:strand:+ start:4123 stop:5511 length:1389 start_codon:yes stop_codon:yes gene_type:complete